MRCYRRLSKVDSEESGWQTKEKEDGIAFATDLHPVEVYIGSDCAMVQFLQRSRIVAQRGFRRSLGALHQLSERVQLKQKDNKKKLCNHLLFPLLN